LAGSARNVPAGKGERGIEGEPSRPTICTFHALCVRILRQHIGKLGYKRNFVIYDESEQLGAMKKVLSHISVKGEKVDPAAVLNLVSRFKNAGERALAFADPATRAMAEHIHARYASALRACNAVDFDDLILLTLRLFAEHEDVLETCRTRYRYVMVDEYQDTNAGQFELINSLTREHRNLCVVGDDDQSIYGWRGAEIANLLDMEKHFPEVKVIKLEQNYRSTNTILNAANALITRNVRRRAKRLWSQQAQGPKILLHTFDNDDQEACGIVEQIQYARLAHRAAWGDHAILFRTNLQSRPLETALRQANVRYHLIGGQSFFDRREIRDVLAFLKTLLNPDDDISLLRIANVPARGMSDATMERLLAASHERKCSVFAAMKNRAIAASLAPQARTALEGFVSLIERARAPLSAPPPQGSCGFCLASWADRFLDQIGYLAELRRSEKTAEAGEARARNVREFIATLDQSGPGVRLEQGGFNQPSMTPLDRLEAFLEQITLESDREEEQENPGNAVTLITMHSCKGLEFPHVYIVGLEEGLLPHARSEEEERSLDEERRLFYVAITRAMRTLTISHCSSRKKFGQPVPCHPSRFLSELPQSLLEHADAKAKQPVPPSAAKEGFAVLRAAAE
jgi:superfamily I DNA/RNA helicase